MVLTSGAKSALVPTEARSLRCLVECAGVGLEVSRIVELCGIHEDADDAAITFAESSLDEAQVSSVKCPHGGDEGDAMPLCTLRRYEGLEVFDALI